MEIDKHPDLEQEIKFRNEIIVTELSIDSNDFGYWPESENEIFRVIVPDTRKSILNFLSYYVKWCRKNLPFIQDINSWTEGSKTFVNGVIVDAQGQLIVFPIPKKNKVGEKQNDHIFTSMEERYIDAFGYMEILQVHSNHKIPVEIRIVCSKRQMISFWGCLVKAIRVEYYLDELKPEIWNLGKNLPEQPLKAQIQTPISSELSNRILQVRDGLPAGRRPTLKYNEAFDWLIKHKVELIAAYEHYLMTYNLPDRKDTKRYFIQAMNSRMKKAERGGLI